MHKLLTLFVCFHTMMATAQTFPAKALKISWEVIENGYQGKDQTLSVFTLVNTGKQPLPTSGWTIYYNFIRYVHPGDAGDGIEAGHVNGHLYTLQPSTSFKGLPPGHSIRIKIVSDAWLTNMSDVPEGPYIVWKQQPGKGHSLSMDIIPSATAKQLRQTADEQVVQTTPAEIYQRNGIVTDIPENNLPALFPTPVFCKMKEGNFIIGNQPQVSTDEAFGEAAAYLADVLGGTVTAGKAAVRLQQIEAPPGQTGKYKLSITSEGITIAASDVDGIFNGIQSVRYLKGAGNSLPCLEVEDMPRFGFRSFSLDVARNFQPKAEILRLLDLMALYKLNVFHFHLTDDEGWRLEIPGLPELTEVGGRRGHTVDELTALQPSFGSGPDVNGHSGTGWYTKADYIEIVRYAKARNIKVIPEIEVPGHARAAIRAMEARYARFMHEGHEAAAGEYRLVHPQDKSEYHSVQQWRDNVVDPALPSTYRFLEKVVDELAAMHKAAGAPMDIIHMGGDETPAGVWIASPACRQLVYDDPTIENTDDLWYYFYNNVSRIVNSRGLQFYGWEEAGMRKTKRDGRPAMIPNPDYGNRNFQLDVWNNIMGGGMEDLSYRLANAGYKVVLSGVSNYYFDMAYTREYDEPGFYWGGFVDIDKPFYFIPFDLYKNAKEDERGHPLPPNVFTGKDRLTDYGAANIVGIQGLMWSETIKNPQQLEYLLLPKLLGMAERAWAYDPAWATEPDPVKVQTLYEEAWSIFANVVGKRELPRLAVLNGGYHYRIPTPGAITQDGKVLANVQLPGLVIRYTTDGKEPTATSPVYTAPVAQKGTVKLKAFDSTGRSGRTVTVQH